MLAALLRESPDGPTVDDFIQARRKDKRIAEQITEELCKTFVTPLEREDIEALSVALYQIPKTAEKFSVLELTNAGGAALKERRKITLTKPVAPTEPAKHRIGEIACDEALFGKLREVQAGVLGNEAQGHQQQALREVGVLRERLRRQDAPRHFCH